MKKTFAISIMLIALASCGSNNKTTTPATETAEEEQIITERVFTPEEQQLLRDLKAFVGDFGAGAGIYHINDSAPQHLPYASERYAYKDIVLDSTLIKTDNFKITERTINYDHYLTDGILFDLNRNFYSYDHVYRVNNKARINEIQTYIVVNPHLNTDSVAVLLEKIITDNGYTLKRKKGIGRSNDNALIILEKGDTVVEIDTSIANYKEAVSYNIRMHEHDKIHNWIWSVHKFHNQTIDLNKLDSIPRSQCPR